MLNAFKQHLKHLAADPSDGFDSRIRTLAGSDAAVPNLRKMILSTPYMADRVCRWSRLASSSPALRRRQKFALAYLYSPIDFLPEDSMGLFGYLDDSYLVAMVYEASRNELEARGVPAETDDRSLRDQLTVSLAATRRVLPETTRAIDKLLEEVASGGDVRLAVEASAKIGAGGWSLVEIPASRRIAPAAAR